MQKLYLWQHDVTSCNDTGLQTIADNVHDLRSIELRNFYSVSDSPFVTIAKACTLLTSFAVNNCVGFTDKVLRAVGLHCPLLDTLYIDSNDDITDGGIAALVHGCRRLKRCGLALCSHISNTAVFPLVQYCASLCKVILSGVVLITDEAIREVFRQCANLQILYACYCPLVTAACLETLHNRKLESVTISDSTLRVGEREQLYDKYPLLSINNPLNGATHRMVGMVCVNFSVVHLQEINIRDREGSSNVNVVAFS